MWYTSFRKQVRLGDAAAFAFWACLEPIRFLKTFEPCGF
jgi:hypothetical protein